MEKLPRPSIDTGMGLERITAVLQGAPSNFDTDLFSPIFESLYKIISPESRKNTVSARVIADHIRAMVFMITDGVLPANEGRGYVLRRILRRAIRHGWVLDLKEPFLHKMGPVVADTMGAVYPELENSRSLVSSTVLHEEERFAYTLENGMSILERLIKENRVSGAEIFKLYDTYGFPLDLSYEILQERGMGFKQEEFDVAMEEQRDRARKAWKGSGEVTLAKPAYLEFTNKDHDTIFLGYDQFESDSQILGIISNGQVIEEAHAGEEVELILDRTPFYAEMGGQVADTGVLVLEGVEIDVTDTIAPVDGITVHQGTIKKGSVCTGTRLEAQVDIKKRKNICRNHTATHILHAVLREVLGDHVKQSGSLVTPDRLRFDFTHFSPVTPEAIRRIEDMVNQVIRDNYDVSTTVMSLEGALKIEEVQALFGEKYDEIVRVVEIPDLSVELCGGTHCRSTGDIFIFKIVSEGGIAAGVRRIEAITGEAAYRSYREHEDDLGKIADLLKAPVHDAVGRVVKLLNILKQRDKELEKLKLQMGGSKRDEIIKSAEDVDGIQVMATRLDDLDINALRSTIDDIRFSVPSSLTAMASDHNGKVTLIVATSKDIISRINASDVIKELSKITGGRGGGRADMAQAGGGDPKKINSALEKTAEIVRKIL
jgi:alanyl-tRNA synthetase